MDGSTTKENSTTPYVPQDAAEPSPSPAVEPSPAKETPANENPEPLAIDQDATAAMEPLNVEEATQAAAPPADAAPVVSVTSVPEVTTSVDRTHLTSLPDPTEVDADATQAMSTNEMVLDGLETPIVDVDDSWHPADDEPQGFSPAPIGQGFDAYATPEGVGMSIPARRGGTARRVLLTIVIVLLVLGGIYAGVAIYFTHHFLPNTTVNGEEVSGMAIDELSAHVTEIGKNYAIKVSGDGIDLTIPSADIDFVYDGDAYGNEAAAQILPWQWLPQIMNAHTYTVSQGVSFNQDKLNALLTSTVAEANKGATPPTNATMAYDATNQVFVPVSQALGTEVDPSAVISAVSEAVSTMQQSVSLGDTELVQPTITTEDEKITSAVSQANNLLDQNISMFIAGTDVMSIEKDLMASWISLDENRDFTTNIDLIKQWTQGELSEFLDTVGSKRTYTRPDGKVIDVEGGTGESAYGWLLDGEALANALSDKLRANDTQPLEIPMKKTAANWARGGQEWPNRYIDVDLGEQYVRMYDESSNLIWEAPCVSGNPIYGGGTDPGVYYIYEKDSPRTLIGLDYDGNGEPDYRTDVTFWMPFDGGEGLHDAGWRYYFGGSIYTYDGSHGCVNLPYGSAQELYGITNVGDVVVVHW